ncbi:MAG: ATP-binding protein, partial [Bdellovibrionota bacterium]
VENAAVGIALISLCIGVFARTDPDINEFPKLYLFFPLLAWASVRFGQTGTTTAIFFVTAFSIWATALQMGPFANEDVTQGLLRLQAFVLALSLTSLLLVAYVAELRTAERNIQRKNEELEKLVDARTHQLKLANQNLVRKQSMLDEAQRVANLGSWDLDVKTGRVFWSKSLYEILDVKPEEFDGTYEGYLKMNPEETRTAIESAYEYTMRTKMAKEFDYPIVTKSGRPKIMHARGSVFLDESGEVSRIIGTSQDVTESRRIEEELRRARKEADEANQAKSNFLANMSHEIRTPLSIILGFSELLVDPHESEETRREFAKTIQKNGAMLSDLISDVLDLAKVEAGKVDVRREPVVLQEFLQDLEELMKPKSREAGLDLRFRYFGTLPTRIETDPRLLRQAFVNIVGNAIKFTPSGSVEVRTTLMETPHGESRLTFDVVDTGIGMTEDQKARLFRRFAQADETMTRKFGGTGLGLILSKKFVQCLGGDLRIRATSPGRGSCFRMTIDPGPLDSRDFTTYLETFRPEPASAATANRGAHDLEGKEVLVVDDSIDNQKLVSHFLKAAGAHDTGAMNGAEGMEKALGGHFDIVLMDIQMPVLDGLRATAALRKKGFRKPIVALTAHALAEEKDLCLHSGFDAYLSKPISRTMLVDQLADLPG